ncbi:hypothetical protein ACET4Y_02120 [Pseudomonas aeruginosa]
MSEVERFNEYTWGVTEDEHGEYVRYADYYALAAEAQALREEVAALRARADVVPEVFGLERYRVEKLGRGSGHTACVRGMERVNCSSAT